MTVKNFAALAALALLAGCADPVPVVVDTTCVRLSRPGLADLCPWGVVPAIGLDGYPSCSTVTERDGRALWASRRAWDEACGVTR